MTASDITIRDLTTLQEYQECCELQEETWGRGFKERVPTAILRVGQKIGGVTAGAFDANGRMVGFVFGLTGIRHGRLAHWSDMLAVREEARGHHIGERLKHYQRERLLAIGVEVMYWTFDPLVSRNAHLNLNRLGARATEYVEDMYGSNTGSSLHGQVPTDRFVAEWELRREFHPPADGDAMADGDARAPLLNPVDDHGRPLVRPSGEAPQVRVQVPVDSGALTDRPDEALAWRLSVRAAISPLLAGGAYHVARFVRPQGTALPYYVLSRNP